MSVNNYPMWMAHGVQIGDMHSWRDWRLVPKKKLVVDPPDYRENGIKVPGRHGKLNANKALTGDVIYENRVGSWEFRIRNLRHFRLLYSEIMDYVQGQELTVILDDDDYFYYRGVLKVEKWTPEQVRDTLVIKYDLQPFKMERDSSLEDWLWDLFDFDCGIAREYHDLTVDGERQLLIPGRRLPVCPGIYVTGTVSVSYGGASWTLTPGVWNYIDSICLGEGDHTLVFSGDGTVSVDYRGGRL